MSVMWRSIMFNHVPLGSRLYLHGIVLVHVISYGPGGRPVACEAALAAIYGSHPLIAECFRVFVNVLFPHMYTCTGGTGRKRRVLSPFQGCGRRE